VRCLRCAQTAATNWNRPGACSCTCTCACNHCTCTLASSRGLTADASSIQVRTHTRRVCLWKGRGSPSSREWFDGYRRSRGRRRRRWATPAQTTVALLSCRRLSGNLEVVRGVEQQGAVARVRREIVADVDGRLARSLGCLDWHKVDLREGSCEVGQFVARLHLVLRRQERVGVISCGKVGEDISIAPCTESRSQCCRRAAE